MVPLLAWNLPTAWLVPGAMTWNTTTAPASIVCKLRVDGTIPKVGGVYGPPHLQDILGSRAIYSETARSRALHGAAGTAASLGLQCC